MMAGVQFRAITVACGVCDEAVRNAAALTGLRVFGKIILCDAKRLPDDFFRHLHFEHDAIESAALRKVKNEKIDCYQESPQSHHRAQAGGIATNGASVQ